MPMPDDTPEVTTEESPVDTAPPDKETQDIQVDDLPLGDAGKRAIAAERERYRRLEREMAELRPLAEEAKKLREAQMTEVEKLREQLEGVTSERDRSTAEAMRLRAALEAAPEDVGYDQVVKLAGRLQGSTPEELAVDAKELFGQIATPPPRASSGKPVENLRPGNLPKTPDADVDTMIAQAEAKGDYIEATRLKGYKIQGLRATMTQN